jgi:hypothetical protein
MKTQKQELQFLSDRKPLKWRMQNMSAQYINSTGIYIWYRLFAEALNRFFSFKNYLKISGKEPGKRRGEIKTRNPK